MSELRMIDPATGELAMPPEIADLRKQIEDLAQQVVELEERIVLKDRTIGDLERDLRGKRKTIREHTEERITDRNNDPRRVEVRPLFDYWRERSEHPRAQLDDKRFDRILWGLSNYGAESARKAIDYVARFPYVTDKGRSQSGRPSERHDSIELIFRSAEKTERFIALGEQLEHHNVLSAPSEVPAYLLEHCDCNHLRMEHSRSDPDKHGWQGCLARDCDCFDFDDIHTRADKWLDENGARPWREWAAEEDRKDRAPA